MEILNVFNIYYFIFSDKLQAQMGKLCCMSEGVIYPLSLQKIYMWLVGCLWVCNDKSLCEGIQAKLSLD